MCIPDFFAAVWGIPGPETLTFPGKNGILNR